MKKNKVGTDGNIPNSLDISLFDLVVWGDDDPSDRSTYGDPYIVVGKRQDYRLTKKGKIKLVNIYTVININQDAIACNLVELSSGNVKLLCKASMEAKQKAVYYSPYKDSQDIEYLSNESMYLYMELADTIFNRVNSESPVIEQYEAAETIGDTVNRLLEILKSKTDMRVKNINAACEKISDYVNSKNGCEVEAPKPEKQPEAKVKVARKKVTKSQTKRQAVQKESSKSKATQDDFVIYKTRSKSGEKSVLFMESQADEVLEDCKSISNEDFTKKYGVSKYQKYGARDAYCKHLGLNPNDYTLPKGSLPK